MKKPFIKRKAFFPPSSAKEKLADRRVASEALPLDFLNRTACFETLRAYTGKIFVLEEHLGRLSESCQGICRNLPFRKNELKRWTEEALKESQILNARLRLSIHWNGVSSGTLLLMISEFKPYPKAWAEKGVHLMTTAVRRWTLRAQDSQIKSSAFVGGVMAFLEQGSSTAQELIFLNQEGNVSEGTISNIFIVREKRLLTPAAGSGILRGVTRGIVMDLARKRGMEVKETFFSRHDIYSAEECFMTNTSSEVLPVVSVDRRKIADGRPGSVTKILAVDFKAFIKQELGKI